MQVPGADAEYSSVDLPPAPPYLKLSHSTKYRRKNHTEISRGMGGAQNTCTNSSPTHSNAERPRNITIHTDMYSAKGTDKCSHSDSIKCCKDFTTFDPLDVLLAAE